MTDTSATPSPSAPAAKGTIGFIPCLAFAVGTMVGGGVFTLSGTAINQSGAGAIISYLLAGIVMLLSALCFVSVAGRAKPGDSGYGPISTILSPGWRFLSMWGFYLNALFLITFLVVSFGQYLNQYFIGSLGTTAAAVIALLAIAVLNLGPSDLIAKTETGVVAIKIALLLVFIGWGVAKLGHIDTSIYSHQGHSIFGTAALLFTAYTGFNVVTNMASSLRNPERDVPRAVIGSIVISGLIYIGVIFAMLASHVSHFGAVGVSEAATALIGSWGGTMIAFAACLSTLSGANANVLGASELTLRMVAQGDTPPALGRTNHRGHPVVSVVFIAIVALLLTLFANVNNIVNLANVGALVAMIVVDIAAFRLARQGFPGKGLRLPGGVTIPVIAGISCVMQFPSLGWKPTLIGLAFVAAGFLLYANRHKEHLGHGVVELVTDTIHRIDTPLQRALSPHQSHSHRRHHDADHKSSTTHSRPHAPGAT